MPSLFTFLLTLPLALAAALSTPPLARRLAWLAVVTYALGAASVRVAIRLPVGARADLLWIDALPVTSLRIDAGLQLLAAMLAVCAAAASVMRHRAKREGAAAIVGLCSAVAIVVTAVPLLRVTGWGPPLAAAVALGAAFGVIGGAIAVVATRLSGSGRDARQGDRVIPIGRGPARWGIVLGLGAIAAIAAPHLYLVLGGAVAAAIAAHALVHRTGVGRLPVFPAVATGTLAFVGYYLHVIAGPGEVSLVALPAAPLSSAAQAFLVPALAIGAAGFFGLWPLGAFIPGVWLAPIGVALLLRVGADSLPLGIEGWRTVAIPVGVLAAWAAALGRRPLALATAGGWMACFASTGTGAVHSGAAGAWLLALVPMVGLLGAAETPGNAPSALLPARAAVVALVAVLGATLALDALLRVEVVYAVLAAAAAAFSAVYISPAHT